MESKIERTNLLENLATKITYGSNMEQMDIKILLKDWQKLC
jgi:hypothetical protein